MAAEFPWVLGPSLWPWSSHCQSGAWPSHCHERHYVDMWPFHNIWQDYCNIITTNADPCIPCTRMFVSMLSDAGIRGPAQCSVSGPAESSGLDLRFRAPQQSRPGSSANVERPSGASGLDLGNVGMCSVFEQPGRAISCGLERPFRATQRSRAAISSASAEPRGLDVANVGRCGIFKARPNQLSELGPGTPLEVQAVLRKF